MKLFRINSIVCNSKFTKKYIDKEFGVKSIVIYPPVDVEKLKPKRKENLIISIGRFSQLTQAKRQDILIRAFKKIYDSGLRDWKLILAGGVEIGVTDYVKNLRGKAKGYPIEIIESPSWKEIRKMYGKAKIFWSASGYGIDEKKEPKRVEHFGITVVEAMAGGAVPLVCFAGGHKEIVSEGKDGYLWATEKALLLKTKALTQNRQLLLKLSKNARQSSKVYEYARFEAQVSEIL
jgi:glycosyltransferase involved in cell wall biosynthesis